MSDHSNQGVRILHEAPSEFRQITERPDFKWAYFEDSVASYLLDHGNIVITASHPGSPVAYRYEWYNGTVTSRAVSAATFEPVRPIRMSDRELLALDAAFAVLNVISQNSPLIRVVGNVLSILATGRVHDAAKLLADEANRVSVPPRVGSNE